MSTRGQWLRNKQTHDQRDPFYAAKPKLLPEFSELDWIAPFMSSVERLTESFRIDSIIVLPLGSTKAERETKLRLMSSKGYLHMSVVVRAGQFLRYEWRVR